MTLWRSGGAETAASAATSGTDDLEGALAREHGRLVRVARAERDWIAPRYTAPARTRPRSPRAAPRAAPRRLLRRRREPGLEATRCSCCGKAPFTESVGVRTRAAAPWTIALNRDPLIGISSPYGRRGVLSDAYRKHHGWDGDVLVWQAPTCPGRPCCHVVGCPRSLACGPIRHRGRSTSSTELG